MIDTEKARVGFRKLRSGSVLLLLLMCDSTQRFVLEL